MISKSQKEAKTPKGSGPGQRKKVGRAGEISMKELFAQVPQEKVSRFAAEARWLTRSRNTRYPMSGFLV